ncbi:MAG: NAD(P)H-binding protein [Bacteroidetes bacterium]|nr:NAD(P)H-binding protein [Bacteroidota bacterium]
MAKTAFVFGASGLVGSNLYRQLLNNPDYEKVILIIRKPIVVVHPKAQEISLSEYESFDFTGTSSLDLHAFCCLGTTIKKAGSKDEFKKVDYELPLKIAEWAKANGIETFVAVSSIGASSGSGNFYLKTKGEMEEAIKTLGIPRTVFVRPSLLMGNRNEFRLGEEIAKTMAGLMNLILFGSLKNTGLSMLQKLQPQ